MSDQTPAPRLPLAGCLAAAATVAERVFGMEVRVPDVDGASSLVLPVRTGTDRVGSIRVDLVPAPDRLGDDVEDRHPGRTAHLLAVVLLEALGLHFVGERAQVDALAAAEGELVDAARVRAVVGVAGVGEPGGVEEVLPDLRVRLVLGVLRVGVGVEVGVTAHDDRPAHGVLGDEGGELGVVLSLERLVLRVAAGLTVQVEELLREHLTNMGWTLDKAVPQEAVLRQVGLDDVADELWRK